MKLKSEIKQNLLRRNPSSSALVKILTDQPVPEPINWQHLGPQIINHGLGSRVYRQIKESKISCHDLLWLDRIKQEFVAQAFRAEQFKRTLEFCQQALAHKKIEFAVLKGAPLAERFYKNSSDRRFTDLDLYIPSHERGRALEVMADLGLHGPEQTKLRENANKVVLLSPDKLHLPIELHFGFGTYPIKEPVCIKGLQIDAANEMDYLVYHAFIQHRMSCLMWLMDFIEISRKTKGEFKTNKNNQPLIKAYNFLNSTLANIDQGGVSESWVWNWILEERAQKKLGRSLCLRWYFTSGPAVLSYWLRKSFAS